MNSRKYELDWLRVLAILVVFFYHTMRFFDLDNWQIKNAYTYLYVEMLTHFIERWMMPLFFVISGASLYYLLKKRGPWSQFYVGKFHRLMIPVVVAVLTHSALQVYLEKLTHGSFRDRSGSSCPIISAAFICISAARAISPSTACISGTCGFCLSTLCCAMGSLPGSREAGASC
jgi:fucose 4-O-acetylase-like acetyltransferase